MINISLRISFLITSLFMSCLDHLEVFVLFGTDGRRSNFIWIRRGVPQQSLL